jgi:hypothetical protein
MGREQRSIGTAVPLDEDGKNARTTRKRACSEYIT